MKYYYEACPRLTCTGFATGSTIREALAVVLEIAAKKSRLGMQLAGTHDCLYAWKVEEVERSATALVMIH